MMTNPDARARRADPWTSWAAARSIDCKPSEAAVLLAFHTGDEGRVVFQAYTLEEIVLLVPRLTHAKFSDSRIRTAVADLMRRDPPLLVDTGRTALTAAGRRARLISRPTTATLF